MSCEWTDPIVVVSPSCYQGWWTVRVDVGGRWFEGGYAPSFADALRMAESIRHA